MSLLRTLVLLVGFVFAVPVHAQANVRWAMSVGPNSVELHQWTQDVFVTQLVNIADGSPAAGVPFTYRTEWQCGSFVEGLEMTGISDEAGFAYSSRFYGAQQDLGCKVTFDGEGVDYAWVRRVNIFYPEAVTLALERSETATVFNHPFEVWVYSTFYGEYVNTRAPDVTVGASASGATATFLDGSCPYMNSGLCVMRFVANDRPGPYSIQFSYGQSTVAAHIRQRPK